MDPLQYRPTPDAVMILRRLRETQAHLRQVHRPGQIRDLEEALTQLDRTVSSTLIDLQRGDRRFSGDLVSARTRIIRMLNESPDIVVRSFTVGVQWRWPALLVFVDGLVGNEMIDQDTIQRLQDASSGSLPAPETIWEVAQSQLVTVGHVTKTSQWSEIIEKILSGNAGVFLAGCPTVLLLDTVKYPARSITRAMAEPAIKGPQESFNGVGLTHMDQLRRWIRSPQLHFDAHTVGTVSRTSVLVAYLDGIVNPTLLAHVTDRIERVSRDLITRANELGEYLPANRLSLFPLYRLTERVDWVARELGEGKIAIMVENDPFAIVAPMTLVDFYQTSQDYSFSWWDGSLVRMVRLVSLLIGLYLMPLYIALTSVDVDLIPTPLLLTIAGSRQGIPFPPIVEVIIMYFIVEILREAANRLPKELAVTLGTVGAVVVGTAIVRAGIVDDVMIVSATLTALGLFTTPAFEMTTPWRWLFWVMILGSFTMGIFGMIMVTVGIVGYLASLESFGVPYLSPFGPLRGRQWSDAWCRAVFPWLQQRPSSLRPVDRQQAAPDHAPDSFRLSPSNDR